MAEREPRLFEEKKNDKKKEKKKKRNVKGSEIRTRLHDTNKMKKYIELNGIERFVLNDKLNKYASHEIMKFKSCHCTTNDSSKLSKFNLKIFVGKDIYFTSRFLFPMIYSTTSNIINIMIINIIIHVINYSYYHYVRV